MSSRCRLFFADAGLTLGRRRYTAISRVDDHSPDPIWQFVDVPGCIEPDNDELSFAPVHDCEAHFDFSAYIDRRRRDGGQDLDGTHPNPCPLERDSTAEGNTERPDTPRFFPLSKLLELVSGSEYLPTMVSAGHTSTFLEAPGAQAPSDPSKKRSRGGRRVSDVEAVLRVRSAKACAISSSRKTRRGHHSGHFGKDHNSPKYCGRCSNHGCNGRELYLSRLRVRAADGLSMAGAGLATVAIITFNQALGEELPSRVLRMGSLTDDDVLLGTCPSLESDHRWLASLSLPRYLPPTLRCPSLPVYIVAISVYSVAGVFQVAREPRYWADCALVAVLVAVVTGALHGIQSMLDALILGGFLSLVCCRGIAWSASACVKD